jgi:hypothetical protein
LAEVSDAELALIVEALEDAAYYRDTRSRVLDSAVRRQARRSSPAIRSGTDEHREKARAYNALAARLKGGGQRPAPT